MFSTALERVAVVVVTMKRVPVFLAINNRYL